MNLFSSRLSFAVPLLLLAAAACVAQTATPTPIVIGFDVPGAWHSVPRELIETTDPALLWCSHAPSGKDWRIDRVSLGTLDDGLQPSTAHMMNGRSAGVWADHPLYPTIARWDIPHDWSAYNELEVRVYSEVATGETVTIGLLSDNSATPWKDYYLYDFPVDWAGWKTLRIPFDAFHAYQQPAGWNKIDEIAFFTKIFRRQPNPYTSLTFDSVQVLHDADRSAPIDAPAAPGFMYVDRYEDEAPPLNHAFPETDHPQAFAQAICQQCYFRDVRALYKYYPRFAPGYPSFDAQGRAYINAGDSIEWLNHQGQWQKSDIEAEIIAWGKRQGWAGIYNAWGIQGSDPMIRFDNDGAVYVLEEVEALNSQGERFDRKTRTALLFYSRDHMKTWTIYRLPWEIAAFEKLDGHNQECLSRPPVILNWNPVTEASAISIPEKLPDGSLRIAPFMTYAPGNSIDVEAHSGDGNMAITHNGKVYIAYGWCPDPDKQTGAYKSTMPAIPPDHPGLNQQFVGTPLGKPITMYSKNGVPTYVVAYDIATRALSAPVYVGSAGGSLDGHNWAAITVDSRGILTVVMNGHHMPLNVAHTLRPDDISSWSAPQYVFAGTTMPNLSYATLTCGDDDSLYTVHRSTKDIYNNHLGLYVKPPGGDWQPEKTLVAPFKMMYKVWYQRMTYDSHRDRLFLTYFADGLQEWYTWDQYSFYNFIWPDKEKLMNANFGKAGTEDSGATAPGRTSGGLYRPGATEIDTIVSEDHGKTWHLATTADFAP